MNDTTVVTGLVRGQPILGLEHDDRDAGALDQRHGGGHADDSTADDDDVAAGGFHDAIRLSRATPRGATRPAVTCLALALHAFHPSSVQPSARIFL